MGIRLKTFRLQLLVTGLTLSSLILDIHHAHANPSCPSHFQALLKTAIEKKYPPSEFEQMQEKIMTQIDQIYKTQKELSSINFLKRKSGLHYDLNQKQMNQIKELFEVMGIQSEVQLTKVKWHKKANPLLINKKIAELVIDTASLEHHYPTLARAIKRAKTQSDDGKVLPLKFKVNSLTNSLAHYNVRHEVVIVRDLDAVLDVFVGGGYDSESVWHELMHAYFKNGYKRSNTNHVYNLQFLVDKKSIFKPLKRAPYHKKMTVEEIYNHLNGMIWILRNLKQVNSNQMENILERIIKREFHITDVGDYWQNLFALKKDKRLLKNVTDAYYFEDLKLMEFKFVDFFENRYLMGKAHPELKNLKLVDPIERQAYIQNHFKHFTALNDEAKIQSQLLQNAVVSEKEYWHHLAQTDPERCRQELLKLHQKHFRFLKKKLHEPVD